MLSTIYYVIDPKLQLYIQFAQKWIEPLPIYFLEYYRVFPIKNLNAILCFGHKYTQLVLTFSLRLLENALCRKFGFDFLPKLHKNPSHGKAFEE